MPSPESGSAVLDYGRRATEERVLAMGKAKIAVLLLTILILGSSVISCGFTSQGPEEQKRPAESPGNKEDGKTSKQNEKPPEKEKDIRTNGDGVK